MYTEYFSAGVRDFQQRFGVTLHFHNSFLAAVIEDEESETPAITERRRYSAPGRLQSGCQSPLPDLVLQICSSPMSWQDSCISSIVSKTAEPTGQPTQPTQHTLSSDSSDSADSAHTAALAAASSQGRPATKPKKKKKKNKSHRRAIRARQTEAYRAQAIEKFNEETVEQNLLFLCEDAEKTQLLFDTWFGECNCDWDHLRRFLKLD